MLTADEARGITATCNDKRLAEMMVPVEKCIKETAEHGKRTLDVDILWQSWKEHERARAQQYLEELGYEVTHQEDRRRGHNWITISW